MISSTGGVVGNLMAGCLIKNPKPKIKIKENN
jgi:hypothetical protein